jgi:hypothetical protein
MQQLLSVAALVAAIAPQLALGIRREININMRRVEVPPDRADPFNILEYGYQPDPVLDDTPDQAALAKCLTQVRASPTSRKPLSLGYIFPSRDAAWLIAR